MNYKICLKWFAKLSQKTDYPEKEQSYEIKMPLIMSGIPLYYSLIILFRSYQPETVTMYVHDLY